MRIMHFTTCCYIYLVTLIFGRQHKIAYTQLFFLSCACLDHCDTVRHSRCQVARHVGDELYQLVSFLLSQVGRLVERDCCIISFGFNRSTGGFPQPFACIDYADS